MTPFPHPSRLLCSLLLLGALATGHAQVVTHLYHGGEDDSGAANGWAFASFTVDSAGAFNLAGLATAGTYTSATSVPGSSLALDFNGTGALTASSDASLTTSASFVMEVWVNSANLTGGKTIFYNGNTGGNGVGLFLDNNHAAMLGGGTFVADGATTLAANTWYQVALVNDTNAGQLRLYVNGALDDTAGISFHNPTSGALSLGGNGSGGDLFTGQLDEARIFTFTPGTFNTSMLGYSPVPEPSTYAVIFGGLALTGALMVRRRRPLAA